MEQFLCARVSATCWDRVVNQSPVLPSHGMRISQPRRFPPSLETIYLIRASQSGGGLHVTDVMMENLQSLRPA